MQPLKRYVVLPAFGYRSPVLAQSDILRSPGGLVRLSARPAVRSVASANDASTTMHVLDATHEDGPKLVGMNKGNDLQARNFGPKVQFRLGRSCSTGADDPWISAATTRDLDCLLLRSRVEKCQTLHNA